LPGNLTTDRFDWKGVTIFHDEDVLKVGTDSILLATWVSTFPDHPLHVLDVGTGSGVLAILMAQAFPHSVVAAIDPDIHAVHLARHNANASIYKERIQVVEQDILIFAEQEEKRFDLILSNPPFYTGHTLPGSRSHQMAKHNANSPSAWVSAMKKVMNKNGHLFLILPTPFVFEWTRVANACGLYCHDRLDVFSFANEAQSKRTLLRYSDILIKPNFQRMTMFATVSQYTTDYMNWLGI